MENFIKINNTSFNLEALKGFDFFKFEAQFKHLNINLKEAWNILAPLIEKEPAKEEQKAPEIEIIEESKKAYPKKKRKLF